MSRLVDADKLKAFISTHDYRLSDKWNSTDKGMFTCGIMQAIDEQPTADVVDVVYCEDCKHEDTCCRMIRNEKKPSDYCSYGERRKYDE